jgi:YVTN family beta-propeller protein
VKSRLPLLLILFLIPLLIGSGPVGEYPYLSPGAMALSTDGHHLYIICEHIGELRVLDTRTNKIVGKVALGDRLRGIALSPDGSRIYVTSSWTDTVYVIGAQKLDVLQLIPTGFEPIGVVADRTGKTLYVANRLSNDISVIDLETGKEQKRLLAGRGASYLAISPDGSLVFATHVFPNTGAYRTKPQSEITIIDTEKQVVIDRRRLTNVAGVFNLALSGDGKLAATAQLRPKNLIPLAHVAHGYAFGNSLTVFGDGIDNLQVPLDELERYFALPFGVAIAPDHSKIFVSSAGSDIVTAIDVARLLNYSKSQQKSFVNDLSASAHYVRARIRVGRNPRGILLSPDGRKLYVANRLDDTISVIDTRTSNVVSTIDLGGPKKIGPLRRGEQIFNSAAYSFQGQFGCANCHIDGSIDGLTWDLEPDGFGKDIVDNRLLEDLSGTEPFKWNGGNPNMPTECGPRTEKYFYRSQSYNDRELTDLVTYVMTQPFRPNRHRLSNGELTASQERGQAIFNRTVDKTGQPIPEQNQCVFCHSGPKYTNLKLFDVGSGKPTDRSPLVDVPQLNNVGMSAPYLHDGSARSLEEIWTIFNPHDTHGRTNDLAKDELNDLIEYLRTL